MREVLDHPLTAFLGLGVLAGLITAVLVLYGGATAGGAWFLRLLLVLGLVAVGVTTLALARQVRRDRHAGLPGSPLPH